MSDINNISDDINKHHVQFNSKKILQNINVRENVVVHWDKAIYYLPT